MPFFGLGVVFALAGALAGCDREQEAVDSLSAASPLTAFEHELERLRDRRDIPGMSGAIAMDGRLVWARGFGWADRERDRVATPETIYHLASLTKPFTATVLLQLVDEGRLRLAAPVARFGVATDESHRTRVEHLLSHTSAPPAGTRFRYDGGAFAELAKVIEGVTGSPFALELAERVIRPLGLQHTAPNPLDTSDFALTGIDRARIEPAQAREYARAWGRGIWPSGLVGPMRPIDPPSSFHPSAGLVGSALDVVRFSIALDEGRLLSDSIWARATSGTVTPAGDTLPYGLGWFVQRHAGVKLVWHYGHWFSSSSLLVKVPERRLTFVLLANSDGLSRWLGLGDHGDLLRSPAARTFLRAFVTSGAARHPEHHAAGP